MAASQCNLSATAGHGRGTGLKEGRANAERVARRSVD